MPDEDSNFWSWKFWSKTLWLAFRGAIIAALIAAGVASASVMGADTVTGSATIFDGLFQWATAKAAVAGAVLSIAASVISRPFGDDQNSPIA